MNNKITIMAALILSVAFLSFSCNEKDCEAGLGGSVTIAAFAKHHNTPIYSQTNYRDSVFVKFNTKDFPGTNAAAYDLVMEGETGEDHIHISGLKCGDYYFFMTGLDTAINERVIGGIPYTISQTSGEIDLVVPVTED